NPPARGRASLRSWVAAYNRKKARAKIIDAKPVHQRRPSGPSPEATKRMKPKMAARTTTPIAAMASRTAVDSVGNRGPRGAGGGVGSMHSALDRLPALRAELHVTGHVVSVRALQRLRRSAFPAELEPRRNRLAALDARLAPRRDRRVGSAIPAELRRRRVHRAAFRARPLLLLLLLLLRRLGDHPAHLGAHRIAHPDPRAEPDARAGAARRVRGRGFHGVREGELLVRRRVGPAEDLGGGHLLEGFLDRVWQGDVHPADLEDLNA